jgi:hypothetical protein
MPTVSLNEWGVVVRGCTSSTPSILISLSRDSVDGGRGPDMGVYVEYVWLRWGSPVAEPNARGDSVSLGARCGFSNSSGVGFVRFFFPEDDSEPRSIWDICGVVEAIGAAGVGPGGVSPNIRASPCDVSVAVIDVLAFLGGG